MLNWMIQTSCNGEKPIVVSEYVLNELGIFIKRELRMPKNDFLTATTGFRVGYQHIKGTDYRAAPYDRNAILWHKITNIIEDENSFLISGNKRDKIKIVFDEKNRLQVLNYIIEMVDKNPVSLSADESAAAWMCWRDDDEWDEPFATLKDMIQDELMEKRFIEPEILEDTVLNELPKYMMPKV